MISLRAPLLTALLVPCLFSSSARAGSCQGWVQRYPGSRQDHATAYDSARGVTVLFGGYGDGPWGGDETWEWDGNAWTQRVVSGPSRRSWHAMAYDSAR